MEKLHRNLRTRDDFDRLIGREVYTHDGERLGGIEQILSPPDETAAAHPGYFLVVRPETMDGPLGMETAYIPQTAIAGATPDAVELTVERRDVADQRWARLPADLDPRSTPLPEDVPPAPEGGVYEESHRESQ